MQVVSDKRISGLRGLNEWGVSKKSILSSETWITSEFAERFTVDYVIRVTNKISAFRLA